MQLQHSVGSWQFNQQKIKKNGYVGLHGLAVQRVVQWQFVILILTLPLYFISSDLRTIDLRFPDSTRVPDAETTYACQVFALPDAEEYHLIANEPIIDNAYVVHHILLYGCLDSG